IAVVHRSDGSGTTFIFTNYLSKISTEWKDKVGSSTSVNWPGDVGGKGNEGVANSVKQIPGAIGYVEVAYAKQNKIPWVQLQNKAKEFLEPSLGGAEAAAADPTVPRGGRSRGGDPDVAGQYGSGDHGQRESKCLSDSRFYLVAHL